MAEPSPAAQIVINRLVNDLQVIGVWPYFDFLFASNQADQNAALISIKNAPSMAAVISFAGVQFTPYLGFASSFSGASNNQPRIRSPLNPQSVVGWNYQQDKHCFGFWCETEQSADNTSMCGTGDSTINPRSVAGQARFRSGAPTTYTMNVTTSKGLFLANRASSAGFEGVHITEAGVETRSSFTQASQAAGAGLWALCSADFTSGNDQYSTRFWSIQWAGGYIPGHLIEPMFWAFRRFRIAMAALA